MARGHRDTTGKALDPFTRGALLADGLWRGKQWSTSRIMQEFHVSRAQAKRDLAALRLVIEFAAQHEATGQGGVQHRVMLDAPLQRRIEG